MPLWGIEVKYTYLVVTEFMQLNQVVVFSTNILELRVAIGNTHIALAYDDALQIRIFHLLTSSEIL